MLSTPLMHIAFANPNRNPIVYTVIFFKPGFPFDMRKIGLTFMTRESDCQGSHPVVLSQ